MDRYRNIMDESCNRSNRLCGYGKIVGHNNATCQQSLCNRRFLLLFFSIILSTSQLPFIDFTLIMQRWQRAQAEESIEKLGGVTVDEGTSQPIPKLLPLSIATLRGSHKLAHID